MNCAVYKIGSDNISHFIRDCILKRNDNVLQFFGSNQKLGVIETAFEYLWTNDDTQPLGSGWDKSVSDLTPATGTEIGKESHQGLATAVGIRNQLSSLTYAQVETYIDNNVTDMASAKVYLKLLSKIVLAIIKIQDSRG